MRVFGWGGKVRWNLVHGTFCICAGRLIDFSGEVFKGKMDDKEVFEYVDDGVIEYVMFWNWNWRRWWWKSIEYVMLWNNIEALRQTSWWWWQSIWTCYVMFWNSEIDEAVRGRWWSIAHYSCKPLICFKVVASKVRYVCQI